MSDDAEFRIRVNIDASGAKSGAEDTIQDVNKMGDAVEGAGEKAEGARKGIERMVEEAGTVREAQRVAMGFFDTFEGGGRAVEGAAELMRFFLSTAVELDPPLATALILMASLTAVFMKHGDEAKKTGDATSQAADQEKEAIKDLEKSATDSYGNMLDMLKEQTAEMLKQVAAARDLQRAQDELADAQMAGKIADLDEQEQKDLSGKSESEQSSIKRDYEKKRIALRQQEAVDKANQELADKQAEAKAAQQAIDDQKNLAYAEQQKLTQAYGVVQGGAAAGVTGIKSDAQVAAARMAQLQEYAEQGEPTAIPGVRKAISPEDQVELEDLLKKVPELQQKEATNGPDFTEGLKSLQEELQKSKDLEKDALSMGHVGEDGVRIGTDEDGAQRERANQEKISAAIEAINNYAAQMKAAQDVIKDSLPKFQEINRGIPALTTKAEAANTEVAAAQQKATNVQTSARVDTDKLTAQQVREIAKEEFDKREAQREVAKGSIEAQLKDPSLNAQGKAALQQKLEEYTKQTDKDKLDHSADLGLSDAEITKLKGNAVNTQAATDYTAAAEQKKAAEQQARLDGQKDKDDAKAVGQEALYGIDQYSPSRQQAQEAHDAVTLLDQGNAAGATELKQILSQLVGTAKDLTQSQAGMFAQIIKDLDAVNRQLSDHAAQIQRLQH